MTPEVDIAILGAGCAGLSLAVALLERGSALRVLLIEQRSAYERDRTWCFWNTEPHPFQDCVTHQWSRWRVAVGSEVCTSRSGRFSYQHLPAHRFYKAAIARVEASSTQQLCRGIDVRSVTEESGRYRIETNEGAVTARHVFDSRPSSHPLSPTILVQRFLGWHIRTQAPVFDPSTVDLMHFQPSVVPRRNHFVYVLPYSRTEALVEGTYLDFANLAGLDLEGDLRNSIAEQTAGVPYEILFREQGALPMHSALPEQTPGIHIGIRGGRIKPSSGYAFLRIQRQSRFLANALHTGQPLPKVFEPRRYAWLDRIFLEALRRSPEGVPSYFLRLFRRVPADRLVRFRSETGTLTETLQVASALPKLPFLRATISSLAGPH